MEAQANKNDGFSFINKILQGQLSYRRFDSKCRSSAVLNILIISNAVTITQISGYFPISNSTYYRGQLHYNSDLNQCR